jgi:glycosyltransferase involved in cell wall biosynthesis
LADCERAGFPSERLRLVPLGVEARPVVQEEVERVLIRYGIQRPYLLWVGTIEPRKNLPGLLQAYARLSDGLELVLVGPEGWNEDLTALTKRFGVQVNALGFVPHEELPPLYAGATGLCFPSLSEGFGFPVLEAMAQGTPVVTSAGTSTEELAGGAAILVDPRDPAAIADGLERLLDNPGLADELAHAGRARAAEFTWRRTAELVEAAYRELAA